MMYWGEKMTEKEVVFSGVVSRQVFNSENFKVYALDVDEDKFPSIKRNKYKNVSISGEMPELVLGVEYEIHGIETETKYGYGYDVINVLSNAITSARDMRLFLSEILTPNQADVLYENYPDIVQRVKENRLDDIDLNKLHGIGEYTFDIIKNKIIDNYCLSDLVIQFQGYITLAMVKRIYSKYHSLHEFNRKLRQDPYKCLCGIAGVGFKKADSILLKLETISKEQIKNNEEPIIEFRNDLKTSKERCLSCVIFFLKENENEGHTKMNLADLRKKIIETVNECSSHFTDAIKDEKIYYNVNNMDISLKSTHDLEEKIARIISENIYNQNNVWDYDVEEYRKVDGFELSDEQMQVLNKICKYNICILNGAGGTGKTASTQAIIKMLDDNRKSYMLCAPTGKASKVLQENTHRTAKTIHRSLRYGDVTIEEDVVDYDGSIIKDYYTMFGLNLKNKISEDIVIIDEFSMVDIKLFKDILDAIDFKHTKLLMIGDNSQLPSIGCGNLLHDFMQSNIIPTCTLTKVFRYGEGGLMKVATDVRFCKPYLTSKNKSKHTIFGTNKDYVFVDLASNSVPKYAVALYKKLLDKGYSIEDIQVLTAKNVGDCGTEVLNSTIQKVANPNSNSDLYMEYGKTKYYVGDLIIQTENNYKAKIYSETWTDEQTYQFSKNSLIPTAFVANGESGIVKYVANSFIVIQFDNEQIFYTKSELKSIKLGYAITIHKSQGSGFKAVILLTPQSHTFMLNSNLIYTGLTRMKEICYHLGTLNTVNNVVKKKANLERKTFMLDLLSEMSDNKPPWD